MADTFITPSEPVSEPKTEPSDADSRLWGWMKQAASDSARIRRMQGRFDLFDKWLDSFYGKHFPDTMPSYRPPVVINELRTLILSEASDLSDVGFRIYVMKDPSRGGRDESAERAFRALWVREQIDLKIIEAMVWALICGTGFLRVGWDPDAFYGFGDVVVESLDPRAVLPDPDAIDDRKWAFVITESILDLREIRRLFPHQGTRVKPEEQYSQKEAGDELTRDRAVSSTLAPGVPYHGPLTEGDSLIGQYPGYKKARARVLECFVLDETIETVTETLKNPDGSEMRDENGNTILSQTRRMKFPKGRKIVGANGIILYDGKNPNAGGDFGIIRVTLEPPLSRFWGHGFIQQTGDIQLAADKLASAVVENAIRLNNGIMVARGNTGIDWETFSSIPGQILQINRDADFDIKYPNPMPPDMIQAPWRMLDMQRRILGFPDPRTGTAGAGNVSPELTETEISQSQGTTRLRAKQMYHVVQRLAEMIFSRMATNYTVERAIPAVEGESFKPVMWDPVPQPERYAVFVDPATFQVMSRSMLRRLSMALFRMHAIDRQALLEQVGWPDWEAVSKRLDEAEKAAAMAELQAKKARSKR